MKLFSPRKMLVPLAASAVTAASMCHAQEVSNPWTVDAGVSTLGATITPGYRYSQKLGFRAPIGYMTAQRDFDSDGTKLKGDAVTGGIGAILDYYPMDNGLRISGGVMAPLYRVNGKSEGASAEVEGTTYTVTNLKASAYAQNVAPFIGVGYQYGNAMKAGWGGSFDIGALLGVTYDTTYSYDAGSVPAAQLNSFKADVDEAMATAKDELNKQGSVLPFVSISVSYRF